MGAELQCFGGSLGREGSYWETSGLPIPKFHVVGLGAYYLREPVYTLGKGVHLSMHILQVSVITRMRLCFQTSDFPPGLTTLNPPPQSRTIIKGTIGWNRRLG